MMRRVEQCGAGGALSTRNATTQNVHECCAYLCALFGQFYEISRLQKTSTQPAWVHIWHNVQAARKIAEDMFEYV